MILRRHGVDRRPPKVGRQAGVEARQGDRSVIRQDRDRGGMGHPGLPLQGIVQGRHGHRQHRHRQDEGLHVAAAHGPSEGGGGHCPDQGDAQGGDGQHDHQGLGPDMTLQPARPGHQRAGGQGHQRAEAHDADPVEGAGDQGHAAGAEGVHQAQHHPHRHGDGQRPAEAAPDPVRGEPGHEAGPMRVRGPVRPRFVNGTACRLTKIGRLFMHRRWRVLEPYGEIGSRKPTPGQ